MTFGGVRKTEYLLLADVRIDIHDLISACAVLGEVKVQACGSMFATLETDVVQRGELDKHGVVFTFDGGKRAVQRDQVGVIIVERSVLGVDTSPEDLLAQAGNPCAEIPLTVRGQPFHLTEADMRAAKERHQTVSGPLLTEDDLKQAEKRRQNKIQYPRDAIDAG